MTTEVVIGQEYQWKDGPKGYCLYPGNRIADEVILPTGGVRNIQIRDYQVTVTDKTHCQPPSTEVKLKWQKWYKPLGQGTDTVVFGPGIHRGTEEHPLIGGLPEIDAISISCDVASQRR